MGCPFAALWKGEGDGVATGTCPHSLSPSAAAPTRALSLSNLEGGDSAAQPGAPTTTAGAAAARSSTSLPSLLPRSISAVDVHGAAQPGVHTAASHAGSAGSGSGTSTTSGSNSSGTSAAQSPALPHGRDGSDGSGGAALLWQRRRPQLAHCPKLSRRQLRAMDRQWTLEEVARHRYVDDAWIAVGGKVYDITEHIVTHPGWEGAGVSTLLSIVAHCGTECTAEFVDIHRPYPVAWKQLRAFYIGELATADAADATVALAAASP